MHTPIHIVDIPKTDENEDSKVVQFIDKYITCAFLMIQNFLKRAI